MNKKGILFCILSLAAGFMFLAAGQNSCRRGSSLLRGMTMTMASGLEGEQIRSMMDGEDTPYSFAAWTEISGEKVCAADRENWTDAAVTAVCGPSECVLAYGRNLAAGDTKGCVVGKGLAEQLFGGHQVEGQEMMWRGRSWIVRGVIEKPSHLLLIQTYDMREITYDRISVLLEKGGSRRREGEKFTACYGVDAKAVRWDYLYGYDWIEEMIPGKWSDFDGWKRNLEEYREERALISGVEKSLVEAAGLRYLRRGGILICLGVIFCVCAEIAFFRSNNYNIMKAVKHRMNFTQNMSHLSNNHE